MKKSLRTLGFQVVAVGLLGLGASGAARAAGDVYWSIGAEVVPGVTVGIGNSRPVLVSPPVYVVQQPPVVVRPARVVVRPAPVVVRPAPIYYVAPAARHRPPGHWKKGARPGARHADRGPRHWR